MWRDVRIRVTSPEPDDNLNTPTNDSNSIQQNLVSQFFLMKSSNSSAISSIIACLVFQLKKYDGVMKRFICKNITLG